jgi:hypothetical protein
MVLYLLVLCTPFLVIGSRSGTTGPTYSANQPSAVSQSRNTPQGPADETVPTLSQGDLTASQHTLAVREPRPLEQAIQNEILDQARQHYREVWYARGKKAAVRSTLKMLRAKDEVGSAKLSDDGSYIEVRFTDSAKHNLMLGWMERRGPDPF